MNRRFTAAWRRLRRRWRETAITAGLLAVGLGAASAMFAIVDAVIFRPLPMRAPDQLAEFRLELPSHGLSSLPFPRSAYRALSAGSHTLAGVAGYEFHGADELVLRDGSRTLTVQASRVTGTFFDVLGSRAFRGRVLEPADDVPGAEPVMVISNVLWRRRFGGDAEVVGRLIRNPLYGVTYRIVGVMPEGFGYPNGVDAWVPTATYFPASLGDPRDVNLYVVGRLVPGAGLAAAREEVATVARQALPQLEADSRVWAEGLVSVLDGDARSVAWIWSAVGGLFLLLVCINVSGLVLMSASSRREELALRVSLGAGRPELIAQLMSEYLLTALLGGAGGVAVAAGVVSWVRNLEAAPLPRLDAVHFDGLALLAAGILAIFAAALFGVVPALILSRTAHRPFLRPGAAPATRWRQLLVLGQVAITVLVLAVGGVLVRSLVSLERADVGFPAGQVVVAQVDLPLSRFGPQLEHLYQTIDQTLREARALPGVRAASVTALAPFTPTTGFFGVATDAAAPANERGVRANTEYVGDGFLAALDVPLGAGRDFTPGDREGALPVVVVSAGLARRLWGSGDAIGRRIRLGGDSALTVVGVAGNARYRDVRATAPTVYLPYRQRFGMVPFYFLLRTDLAPATLTPVIRHLLTGVDRDLALVRLARIRTWLEGPLAAPRFEALLIALFGLAGLGIATAGLYGVLSTYVGLHTRELGIRLAIGAPATSVRWLVLRRGLRLIVPGVLGGAVAFLGISSRLQSQVFEVPVIDPLSLGVIALLALLIGLLGCWLPAERAARLDPATALRM